MRILVYEFVSAHAPPDAPQELLVQGRLMRDAIVADLVALPGLRITCASAPGLEPSPRPRLQVIRPPAGSDAVAFVQAQAAAHDYVWAVAPESGGLLEALARAVPAPRWLGCTPAAIAIAASKQRTAAALSAAGVAVAPCLPELAAEARGRWVVKPDDGAGACDTVLHVTARAALQDLAQRRLRGQPAVVQPWVDGAAMSLSLLVGAHGHRIVSVNRQQIEVADDGRVVYRGVRAAVADPTPAQQRLAALTVRALPGLRGWVGIDFVASRGGPVLIEVNPRITCAYAELPRTPDGRLARDVLASFRIDVR
ncbi:MAG: ATP-grasp domain-containing protein [Burkholderiaceae bacterium]|nr:ATP-grasp domain-containing protein [Burkholderiaceae bacterium]